MNYTLSTSKNGQKALKLVQELQSHFADSMDDLSKTHGQNSPFSPTDWLRDGGTHGGGTRFVATDNSIFNRASINVSHVHYDDLPDKKLASTTAISAIIHPQNPHAPSIHIHFSWTEMRDGKGYWRMMADLNPSIENPSDTTKFDQTLKQHSGAHYQTGRQQGDDYFHIPALNRHRGVCHFYLESFNSGDFNSDYSLAQNLASAVITCYKTIVNHALSETPTWNDSHKNTQLAYHTAYLFQVLTLDKGTTAGLLVHNQNDLGIMGSLPANIDKNLLNSWAKNAPTPQNKLVTALANSLKTNPAAINDPEKQRFVDIIRQHYATNPSALALQSSLPISPQSTDNHQ